MRRLNVCIFIASLFLAAVFFFAATATAFAEDRAGGEQEQLSLKVYYDAGGGETLLQSYDAPALRAIAEAEGNLEYTYSAFNTYPTARKIEKVTGPTVRGILNDALGSNSVDSEVDTADGIASDWVIEFKSADGAREWFTKKQLLDENRCCFPNWNKEQDRGGQPVLQESMEGNLTEAPAVLSLTEKAGKKEAATTNDSDDVGRLLFGQTAPNEQNLSAFIKYMTTGGEIIIHAQEAAPWNPVTGSKGGSTAFMPGDSITLDRDVNVFHKDGNPRYWIYYTYTRDGSEPEEPTAFSNMYNYNNYDFDTIYEEINKPTITKQGEVLKVRVKVWGYGRLDSEAKTLTFTGKTVGTPTLTAKRSAYNAISLSWTKAGNATGYKIYRSEKNTSNFILLKTLQGNSTLTYKDATCKTGVRYYYKVRAYATYKEEGTNAEKTIYGNYSGPKWSIAALDKNTIKPPSLTTAKRIAYNTIQLNWTKVNYVSGYKIYRSAVNTKSYKLIKTIQGNGTLTYKDATCLTGTRYYYIIKTYTPACNETNASEYTLYSVASNSKYATAYLAKPTIASLTAGKGYATVKWGKIPGATGYVIYRSAKKTSGFKAVKTITKGSTLYFTNKSLVKGKRYYYKIRAYRTVNSKRVYSSYSAVKSVVIK